MPAAPQRSYDSNTALSAKRWLDVWAAGQGLGAIQQVESVADVVERLAHEYAQACQRLCAQALQTARAPTL